jgi:hypothetical protein
MANGFLDIQGKPISAGLLYQIKEDEKGEWSEEKYSLMGYIGNSVHFVGDHGSDSVLTSNDTFLKVRQLEEVSPNQVQDNSKLESAVSQSSPKCTIEKS